MTTTTITTATNEDEIAAGRAFPHRPVRNADGQLIRWDRAQAAAWLTDVRDFWLDATAFYTELAAEGCTESRTSAHIALDKAKTVMSKLAA